LANLCSIVSIKYNSTINNIYECIGTVEDRTKCNSAIMPTVC
jgi:hypothetical protein